MMTYAMQRTYNTAQLLAVLRAEGWPSSRSTLERWIDHGLPFTQPAGANSARLFDWDAVSAWLTKEVTR